MSDLLKSDYLKAVQDFHKARFWATVEKTTARLTGRSADLLKYDEVRDKLGVQNVTYKGLSDIPLEAIVGSVGRYHDFSRSFLPTQDSDEGRWARVMVAMNNMEGIPPIEVYQIGSAYFVKDGHHRVSVARQYKHEFIQAEITEVKTKVPLTPDSDIDDIIMKAELVDFLDKTHLDISRPRADYTVTIPGQYRKLEEHIEVHKYFMGLERNTEVSWEDAAAHWYDTVYEPIERSINVSGLLDGFPNRTKMDLYLWVTENRERVKEALGWDVHALEVAVQLAQNENILGTMKPDLLGCGPEPGTWREQWLERIDYKVLFHDIMVAINGSDQSWEALEQALMIARREEGLLRGLHVVADEEAVNSESAQAVKQRFEERCQQAGVQGQMVIESGPIAKTIVSRSYWVDMVAIKLSHPPQQHALLQLSTGFRTLVNCCPRPMLVVPDKSQEPEHALIAYDGSPKAHEALFVAAYMANKWKLPLSVLTVGKQTQWVEERLRRARYYLESQNVVAQYIAESGEPGNAIMKVAKGGKHNLIIMGGYGAQPILGVMVIGSAVDQVLRESRVPMLICR